jgi:hypothetical protein
MSRMFFEGKVKAPIVKSGRAIHFAVKDYRYKLSDLIYGRIELEGGDLVVQNNHVDMIVEYDPITKSGYKIGGNVSDRVKVRSFTIQSLIDSGVVYIVKVKGMYQ